MMPLAPIRPARRTRIDITKDGALYSCWRGPPNIPIIASEAKQSRSGLRVNLDCFVAPSGRADHKHVADDQHPDHEHRIDRGPTDPGVIGRKLGMDPGQVENGSNPANGMIVGYRLLKVERIKQLSLLVVEPPHHRPPPQRIA